MESGLVNLTGTSSFSGIINVQGSSSLIVGDGGNRGSIAAPRVNIDPLATFGLSRAGNQTVSTQFIGKGHLSLQSTGVYSLATNNSAFVGWLDIQPLATGVVNANYSNTTADVFGTLSGTGSLSLVHTQPGSAIQPGPGSRQSLAIAGLNPGTPSAGSLVFDIYANQQVVTNDYLRSTVPNSAFNVGGLELNVNAVESNFIDNA